MWTLFFVVVFCLVFNLTFCYLYVMFLTLLHIWDSQECKMRYTLFQIKRNWSKKKRKKHFSKENLVIPWWHWLLALIYQSNIETRVDLPAERSHGISWYVCILTVWDWLGVDKCGDWKPSLKFQPSLKYHGPQ